ncbi:MAG: sugar phosphate isomerase/epimerase family protein [Candidatus Bathyarchaeia archaeon]
MTLKLGVTTYNHLWRYTLEETLEHIAKLKFRVIELMTTPPHAWPGDLNKKKRDELRESLGCYSLQVRALNPTFGDLNLASPRPTVRRLTVEELKAQVKLARDIDAEIVVVVAGTGHLVGTPPIEIVWDQAKDGIIECAKFAEDYGVIIGLECAPYRFIENAEQLKRMIEEIGSESVKAVFDTSNSCLRESLPSAIETLGYLIIHVHLADNDCKTWGKLPIGMGAIDFAAVAKALKSIKFRGVSVIELWYPDADPDSSVAISKERLEAVGWSA